MPFIDAKITEKLTEQQKESLKTKLGAAVATLHKSENYLMVGINDGYDLYFAGKKLTQGAFVSVSLFGSASASDYDKMTGEVCRILKEVANVPSQYVYVTYAGVKDWGWNGSNF